MFVMDIKYFLFLVLILPTFLWGQYPYDLGMNTDVLNIDPHELKELLIKKNIDKVQVSENMESFDIDKIWLGIHEGKFLISSSLDSDKRLYLAGKTCESEDCIYGFEIERSLERLAFLKERGEGVFLEDLSEEVGVIDSSFDRDYFWELYSDGICVGFDREFSEITNADYFSCFKKLRNFIASQVKGFHSFEQLDFKREHKSIIKGIFSIDQEKEREFFAAIAILFGEVRNLSILDGERVLVLKTLYERLSIAQQETGEKIDLLDIALQGTFNRRRLLVHQYSIWNSFGKHYINYYKFFTFDKSDIGGESIELKTQVIENAIQVFKAYHSIDGLPVKGRMGKNKKFSDIDKLVNYVTKRSRSRTSWARNIVPEEMSRTIFVVDTTRVGDNKYIKIDPKKLAHNFFVEEKGIKYKFFHHPYSPKKE